MSFAKFVALVAPGLSWDDDVLASANENKGSRSAFRVQVAGATLDAPSIHTTLTPFGATPYTRGNLPGATGKVGSHTGADPIAPSRMDVVFDPSGSRRGDSMPLISYSGKKYSSKAKAAFKGGWMN